MWINTSFYLAFVDLKPPICYYGNTLVNKGFSYRIVIGSTPVRDS